MNQKPVIHIIDGAGYYFRAYFAIRQRLATKSGLPTNAIYGYSLMLKKIIKDRNPERLLIAFDSREKTFRHEMFADYKAHRPDMPEDLAVQLPYIDRLIDALNIPTTRLPGWEADDLIGSISATAVKNGYDVVIVSSDKDMLQLVQPGVIVFDPMKDKTYLRDDVVEKFGAPPELVTDVLGLMGDSSDNIPGVPGVGEKTAMSLVKEYGDIESVIASAGKMGKKKLADNLIQYADQARLSKTLATIATNAPVEFAPDDWRIRPGDEAKLRELFAELEFTSLLKELAPAKSALPRNYTAVLDEPTFANMLAELEHPTGFAVDTETTSQEPMRATLVGISFCASEGRAYYVPLRHNYEDAPEQLRIENVIPRIVGLLGNERIPKFGHNIKYDMIVLAGEGARVSPIGMDTIIASYLLDPGGTHGLSKVAMDRLGEKMTEYTELCGSGVKQITFDKVPVQSAADYSSADADMTFRLANLFTQELESAGLKKLMDDVETPLVYVLARMEMNGVMVDPVALAELSSIIGGNIQVYEKAIRDIAGEDFNPNSPKQLGELLFDKLNLPGGKKTKTGYSTDQDSLEALADMHPLPKLIVEYRQLSRLKSTYADSLPRLINPRTGRIHTSFNQTVAATGRLSSSDPNLQNIPIRTELGRKIRCAFTAPPDCVIVSADYSQIELRLLAHFSGEARLLEAFRNGEDIHSRTAAELFGVSAGFVTRDMRRVAKTVNFGVIYGQTPYGLSRELKIPQGEAKRYIENYFRKYPAIRRYMDGVIESARKAGYVTTILGRRRNLPDLNATNAAVRNFAERNAVNTPMQGSAADLIKMAMIRIDDRLEKEGFAAKMILQVHDELVFETPENESAKLMAMVKEEMEGVYRLSVPLVVDVKAGKNWDEAH